jgi:small subunit ribosomal protein S18
MYTPTKTNTTKRHCYFCAQNIKMLDYKNSDLLKRFISAQSKISKRKRSGTCAKHQHQVAQAIKRARFMALLPYGPSNK